MRLKKIISLFLMAISILFVTTAVADELPKHKLTLEVSGGEVLEKDNIEYLEILLQNNDNVSVIYLEKANDWKVETELIPGTYKIIIRNISPSKYLISNDYSATISDKDITSKISIKEFPSEEVNEKPQEIEDKKPIRKENKEQQQQTTSQNLKTRSIKIAMTVTLCTLAAAVILIILYFISKIIE